MELFQRESDLQCMFTFCCVSLTYMTSNYYKFRFGEHSGVDCAGSLQWIAFEIELTRSEALCLMIQYRWTNHVDVNTFLFVHLICNCPCKNQPIVRTKIEIYFLPQLIPT